MKATLFVILAAVLASAAFMCAGCSALRVEPELAIPRILERQTAAWNRGDVEAFMEPYWQSEDLTFVSGGKVTRGWRETLEGYRKRYPTPAEMGRLTFSGLEVRELGRRAALVLGRWDLKRDPPVEDVGGRFTLLFRRMSGTWVIVYDHTSRD